MAPEPPVPVPLVGTVLLMLVALVIVKVRAARSVRDRERKATGERPGFPPRGDLPSDPAEALARLKSSSGPAEARS